MGPLLVKSTSTRYGDTKPRTSFEMKPSAKEVRGWGLSLNTCELTLLKRRVGSGVVKQFFFF